MPVRHFMCPACGRKQAIEVWHQGGCVEDIRQDCECELTEQQELAIIEAVVV